MNKKHQQAFRELREWCRKFDGLFYVNYYDQICVGFCDNGAMIYTLPSIFDGSVETISDVDKVNHSISPDCIYIFPTPVSKDKLYQLEMDKWAKCSDGWCP